MTAVAVAAEAPPVTASLVPEMTATVRRVVRETPDTATYWLTINEPDRRAAYRFLPGQFNMLYAFAAGEVPISVSSDPGHPQRLAHTVRATGRVTDLFPALRPGARLGLRGPFGTPWPVSEAEGGDLLIVAGGLGLAPVRPIIYEALRRREAFRRVVVLVGARGPEHMLYQRQLDAWSHWIRSRAIEVHLTVDVPDDAWPFGHGVVTTLYPQAGLAPHRTTAFVCGPEIMMRFAAAGLVERGVPPEHVHVSMERNMQCAVRMCGHCQWGPVFVCADGPVFPWSRAREWLEVAQL